jgi:hypothetical protein
VTAPHRRHRLQDADLVHKHSLDLCNGFTHTVVTTREGLQSTCAARTCDAREAADCREKRLLWDGTASGTRSKRSWTRAAPTPPPQGCGSATAVQSQHLCEVHLRHQRKTPAHSRLSPRLKDPQNAAQLMQYLLEPELVRLRHPVREAVTHAQQRQTQTQTCTRYKTHTKYTHRPPRTFSRTHAHTSSHSRTAHTHTLTLAHKLTLITLAHKRAHTYLMDHNEKVLIVGLLPSLLADRMLEGQQLSSTARCNSTLANRSGCVCWQRPRAPRGPGGTIRTRAAGTSCDETQPAATPPTQNRAGRPNCNMNRATAHELAAGRACAPVTYGAASGRSTAAIESEDALQSAAHRSAAARRLPPPHVPRWRLTS